jgi:tetratricopeptide (TPR) repeat protein
LRERLASALDLTGGGGERPERHRTLRDTIAWSIDLLPASDQDLFRRLAVFRGGWTLAAAESVVGGRDVAVLDGLERLVSYSLVRMTDRADPRMTMLDTIRAFAADELRTRADPAGSADRHAVFFLAFAEDAAQHLLGPDRDGWLERLDRDHDNIRAAIEWFTAADEIEQALRLATAVMPFWHLRAHLREGRAVFDSLLATDLASVDPSVLAPATAAAGEITVYQADYPAAMKLTSWSLSLYRSIEDPRGAARQLNNLGWSTMMRDTPEAIGLFEEAERVASPTSALEIVGNALTGRATALFRLGRVEESRAAAGKAIQAFVSSGERFIYVFALLILGAAALSEGRPDVALEQYIEALGMALATGEWTVIGGSLDSVADLLLDHGDLALGIMIASVTARRRAEIGGASSIDMAGKEMPLVRAARTPEPEVFERSCREAEALTVDDVIRAVYALARRVSSGEQFLLPAGETSPRDR